MGVWRTDTIFGYSIDEFTNIYNNMPGRATNVATTPDQSVALEKIEAYAVPGEKFLDAWEVIRGVWTTEARKAAEATSPDHQVERVSDRSA